MRATRATQPANPADEYLTTEEVADLIGTSPGTIHYMRSVGRGPKAYRPGRRLLFKRSEVLAWIEASPSGPDARSNGGKRAG